MKCCCMEKQPWHQDNHRMSTQTNHRMHTLLLKSLRALSTADAKL